MDFIEVYFCELSNTVYDNQLLTLVSDDKKELLKNKTLMNSKLSLYSDLLVRYLVCSKFNIRNNELKFTKNKYGKPYLLNELELFYSISHTQNVIIVAISNEEIGIDIEKIRPINYIIAKRFFTIPEQHYISLSKHKTKAFYEIWTRKEAFIKYNGRGLSMPLTSFDVFDCDINKLIKSFDMQNYFISICAKNNTCSNLKVNQFTEDEIIRLFNKL